MSNDFFLTDPKLPESFYLLFLQVNSKINDIDTHIGKILQEHENEFLTAYRNHMTDIQKEIKKLKHSITVEEIRRKRDEEILSLTKERDWFKDESLRLNKISKEYMKGLEIWKSKATLLESDKKILQEKCRNLKILLEKKDPPLPTPEKKSNLTEPGSLLKSINIATEASYESAVSHMQNEIKSLKSYIKKLKSEKFNIIINKQKLENLFLECVEQVRNDIAAKVNENQSLKELASHPFDTLSEQEKKKILYVLVSKPEISELMRNYLFRNKTRSSSYKKIVKPTTKNFGLISHVFSTPNRSRSKKIIL